VLAALAIGILLYLASACLALLRLGGPLLRGRLLILAGLLVAIVLVGTLDPPPSALLAVAAVGLLIIVIVETVRPPDGQAPSRVDEP
jgi:hypothetical protein